MVVAAVIVTHQEELVVLVVEADLKPALAAQEHQVKVMLVVMALQQVTVQVLVAAAVLGQLVLMVLVPLEVLVELD